MPDNGLIDMGAIIGTSQQTLHVIYVCPYKIKIVKNLKSSRAKVLKKKTTEKGKYTNNTLQMMIEIYLE